jgi:hypothetical protein
MAGFSAKNGHFVFADELLSFQFRSAGDLIAKFDQGDSGTAAGFYFGPNALVLLTLPYATLLKKNPTADQTLLWGSKEEILISRLVSSFCPVKALIAILKGCSGIAAKVTYRRCPPAIRKVRAPPLDAGKIIEMKLFPDSARIHVRGSLRCL